MVKLLRLATDDDSGIFQANFKNPITINPQSQLALLHFTAQIKQETIAINYENNLISFNLEGRTYNTRISRGTYGRANYMDLLEDIKNSLDFACVFEIIDPNVNPPLTNPQILGVEWFVNDVDNKINIGYEYNAEAGYSNFLSESDEIASQAGDVWDLQPAVEQDNYPDYNNAVIGRKSVSLGNGYVRSRVYELNAPPTEVPAYNKQGFIVGLTTSDLTGRTPNSLTEDEITFALGIGREGGDWVYYTQEKDVFNIVQNNVPVNVVVDFVGIGNANNPMLEIMKNGNKVDFAIYDRTATNGRRQIVASTQLQENLELFPFLIFHNDYRTVSTELKWTPTPETTNSNLPIVLNDLGEVNDGKGVDVSLTFGSITLANFLGYNSAAQPAEIVKFPNFIADKEFDVKKIFNTYILELLNLNVESYDSQSEQRKNIIASILTSDDNGVINNENNVIFIDLNNKDKIDLRNISLRLVGIDYTKVVLDGRSLCALLIGDKDTQSF